MEIERLPDELLTTVISLTSPQDACRTAAISPAFRAAADSDAVWSCFLPHEFPRLARKEFPREPLSKKGLFRRLSDQPALLPGKLVSMRLDRATGTKCYTISARALHISWGDTRRDSRWIHVEPHRHFITGGKRFSEAAQFDVVYRLEIRGKIQSKMLSKNTTYTAYMVFKLPDEFYRLDFPFQQASVSVGGTDESTRQVCLQAYVNKDEDVAAGAPPYQILPSTGRGPSTVTPGEDVLLPRRRADGWMEVELGRFYNGEGDDREVSISLMETTADTYKGGLIVRGMELRTKQQA